MPTTEGEDVMQPRSITLRTFVPGIPRTKGSWRIVKGKAVADNKHEKTWATAVGWAAKASVLEQVKKPHAVRVSLMFSMPQPDSPANEFPMGDIDKLTRSVLDALTGIAYQDDCQVVAVIASKRFSEYPGVAIAIEMELAI